MLAAIEAGAEELETSDEVFEIYTETDQFKEVKEALTEAGFEFDTAEITLIPTTYSSLDEATQEKMERLVERLEDIDDVQEVYHNAE